MENQIQKEVGLQAVEKINDIAARAETTLANTIEFSKTLSVELKSVLNMTDDNEFMLSAREADEKANEFLADCVQLRNEINAARSVYTKRFDDIKSHFTAIENSLLGKTKNDISEVSNTRGAIIKRVSDINAEREREAMERYEKEMEAAKLKASMPQLFERFASIFSASIKERFIVELGKHENAAETFNAASKEATMADFTSTVRPSRHTPEEVAAFAKDWLNTNGYNDVEEYFYETASNATNADLVEIYNTYKASKDMRAFEALEKERVAEENRKAKEAADVKIQEVETESSAIFGITNDIDTYKTPSPTFGRDINKQTTIDVTSQKGYAILFNAWFSEVGHNMEIGKLANFKLSSLLVWAKRKYTDEGVVIEGEGITYKKEPKVQVRKK